MQTVHKASRRTLAALDREIERIYCRLAQGRRIDVMKIGQVFAAGHAAKADGRDLEAAIAEAVARLTEAA